MIKKRIAFVHNLPSGGGYRMLKEIINRYLNDFDIDLYSISVNKPKKILGVNNYWYQVKPWKGFVPFNLWIFIILPFVHKSISKKINSKKYDYVFFSHDYFTKSPLSLRYIKSKNKIYLCQEPQREFYEQSRYHAPLIKDKIANILRYPIKYVDEKNASYANIILCNSLYSKRTLEKIYRKKCEVVYPGVDVSIFNPGKLKKENTILCVGGINSVKGQEFLLESLKPLLNKYKLLLIGGGRAYELTRIRKLAKGLNVEIINHASDYDLVEHYRKSKVTCISAYREPFGLSSIESQACGTPVVSIDEGGPRETIIDGETGYLSGRDKDDYLEKVMQALAESKKLGLRGVQEVEKKWTWNRTLEVIDKHLKQ